MQPIKPQTIKNDSHIVRFRSTSTISISFSLVVSVVVMVVSDTGILAVSGCVLNLATSLFNSSILNCNLAFLLCSIASASINTLPALSQRSNASILAESGGVVTVTMCVFTTVSVRKTVSLSASCTVRQEVSRVAIRTMKYKDFRISSLGVYNLFSYVLRVVRYVHPSVSILVDELREW